MSLPSFDAVGVTLLGQEELALLAEGLLDGVARDQRVEARLVDALLRPEDAAETLISDFVGQMGGEITKGAVRVWIQGETREKIYDWTVDLIIPEDDGEGAGPGDEDDEIEVEAEIELIERI